MTMLEYLVRSNAGASMGAHAVLRVCAAMFDHQSRPEHIQALSSLFAPSSVHDLR